jgi:hypothetical protein
MRFASGGSFRRACRTIAQATSAISDLLRSSSEAGWRATKDSSRGERAKTDGSMCRHTAQSMQVSSTKNGPGAFSGRRAARRAMSHYAGRRAERLTVGAAGDRVARTAAMITLQVIRDDQDRVVCRIASGDVPPGPADLRIVARMEVRHERGIPEEATLHSRRLALAGGTQDLPLPSHLAAFDYHGREIALRLSLRLTDPKGKLLAETRLRDEETGVLASRPKLAESPEALMNPEDRYSFFANLRALPAGSQLAVAVLGFGLWLLAGLNVLVGAHDQWVAEPQLSEMQRLSLRLEGRHDELNRPRVKPYVYGKGTRRVPIIDSAQNSIMISLLAWFLVRQRLPRYGDFHLYLFLPPLRRGTRIAARRLVRGRSNVDLFNLTVRVVAANLECWKRKAGAGENTDKEVRSPVRAVSLYERSLPYVPAGSSIGDLLKDDVDFTPMFRALYPPLMVTATHGLELAWQVQLLHPELVDQVLPGPTSMLRFRDFLED